MSAQCRSRRDSGGREAGTSCVAAYTLSAAVAAIPGGVRREQLSVMHLPFSSRSRRDSGGREADIGIDRQSRACEPQSPRFRGA